MTAPGLLNTSVAELSVGPLVTDDAVERACGTAPAAGGGGFDAIPFDAAAARAFGRVAAALRAADRKPAARAYDALSAAVAVANDLPLYTVNPRDFSHIPGLDVHAVPRPAP